MLESNSELSIPMLENSELSKLFVLMAFEFLPEFHT